MKKTLIYASLATLLSMEAQSLHIMNSGEDAELYLHTNIGGEHDEYLVKAKGHQSTTFSVRSILGDLIEELNANEHGYVEFVVIKDSHREFCTYKPFKNTFTLKKGTKLEISKEISYIDGKTIDLSPVSCTIQSDAK